MLEIHVPGTEFWNEITEEFIVTPECTLQLEHSLVSLSKWESKWKKSFLNERVKKTEEEMLDYVRCMTINSKAIDPSVYYSLTRSDVEKINAYISDPMTATTIKSDKKKRSSGIATAEVIYSWMVSLQIPFECQKWHLNRLLTLIQVCNENNKSPQHMSKNDIYKQNAALNKARRAGRR